MKTKLEVSIGEEYSKLNNRELWQLLLHKTRGQFKEYYYQLIEPADITAYRNLFIDKLPYPVSSVVRERYDHEVEIGAVYPTLGGIASIVKKHMEEVCLRRKTEKMMKKTRICCGPEQGLDIPQQYGCRSLSRRISRKKSSIPKKRYRLKRYSGSRPPWKSRSKKQNWKSRKFFRRGGGFRKTNPKRKSLDKKRFCPEGKKTCRCWICNEEGHYANECSQRKNRNNNRAQVFLGVMSRNYEPIEDSDYDSDESYYELVTDSECSDSEYSSDD
ncbi:uncharacterized protein LOC116204109 [Punica granatum]|uniref:Uncharacterized protein LOC116204109 n=1 Tax=Punica granatum TaxID=22663 RepID=A0A6P8D668_PUNGR|nr:uncharacterized protein LOC116204109 [Punica granatum]